MRPLLGLALLAACQPSSARVERAVSHFDPLSGTTLTEESASVGVIGLDDAEVCYTVDGGDPGYGETCAALLDATRRIPLECGFHAVTIRWAEGEATEEASYLVDSPSCVSVDGPVALWQNDELVRAFVAIKDDLQCRMNDCENPAGTGEWTTNCGEGRVDWDVSLSGLRAISVFTYSDCRASTTVEVHDPADPYWLDAAAVLPLEIELVLNGEIRQDTDFSGNGEEAGTVEITADFTGRVESIITITDAARGGGWFEAGCATGPVPGEVCAPGEAMIRYDYPDWSCHGSICPEPGDPPVEGPDRDGDGVGDDADVCPDVSDPYQLDRDTDGLGDACDDVPGFYLLQFKNGERCLVSGSGGEVSSTDSCIATDPSQQWEVAQVSGHTTFRSVGTGACLSHTDSWIGPWTVDAASCDESDSFQQWDLEAYDQGGADAQWPARMHAVSDDFCAYTDLTGSVYGTIGNCDLAGTDAGRKVGIYAYGDFTGAPLAP
ncbi:MAG: hypothetical protein Q8P18_01265 [Pseudomonadota bacterium]|nr:hypothetical protein [Pseudomonadota bacterium]